MFLLRKIIYVFLSSFLLFISPENLFTQKQVAHVEKPKNGTYTYTISFQEYGGKSNGATCTVIIAGDSIKVINNGSITGGKGSILEEGIIMQHKSGKWIIGHDKKDKEAQDIGGMGPAMIDFKKKIFFIY